MSKKMFINATEKEESRVAVLDERGLLENLIIETSAKGQIKGNIYKAVIVNVDPGLEAAFIDYGGNRHGFLPLSDLHQRYYNSPKEVPPQKAHEFLKKGTELLVQAEREEVMHKGAVFTTYLSLPGRFMVIMPESTGGGISRKIEDENDRKSLKETIKILKNEEDNVAIIIRTAGVGHDDQALKDDYQSLLKEYKNILQLFQKKKGPGLIYEDLDMTIRSLRDYFSKDIDEVYIDHFPVYKKAMDFFRRFMPEHLKCVKHYREKRPLFARFNIEQQIEQMYDRMSPLPSGGTICIDPTEALISIDVNSGGAKSEEGQEMLAFQTNVEAAVEIARQLRLRNLGGLIVIDFIDMSNPKLRRIVERIILAATKKDKARIEITPIGKFGLMEMSRQRIKANFGSISKTTCPSCDGKGYHRAIPIAGSSVLRKISDLALSAGNEGEVRVETSVACANYLLNEKRHLLQKIEHENNIRVKINSNDQIHSGMETFAVNTRKALEEEEKKESIAKERRERSSSKIPMDRGKKGLRTTWKIGEGFIDAKELPTTTQEILNEHFYEITGQKPPTEEPAYEQTPTTEASKNAPRHNRKFNRRRFDNSFEEQFAPLPENFTTFALSTAENTEAEAFETFTEIIEEAVPSVNTTTPENTIALAPKNNQEDQTEHPAKARLSKAENNSNMVSEQQEQPSSIAQITIEKVTQEIHTTITESFTSFEVSSIPAESPAPSTKPYEKHLQEKPQHRTSNKTEAEPKVAHSQTASIAPSSSASVEYIDLNRTARNFGLGLEIDTHQTHEKTTDLNINKNQHLLANESIENDEENEDLIKEEDLDTLSPPISDAPVEFEEDAPQKNRYHRYHNNRRNKHFSYKNKRSFGNKNNNGGQNYRPPNKNS